MPRCPDCNHYLTKKEIVTEGEGTIEVDHCSFCGGTFFENFAVNRLPYSSALEIADEFHPAPPVISGWHLCPKCYVPLERIAGEAIPANLILFGCRQCRGNWFPPRELALFKQYQKRNIEKFKKLNIPLPSINSVFIQVTVIAVLLGTVFLSVTKIRESIEMRSKAKEALLVQPYVIPDTANNQVKIVFATKEKSVTDIIIFYNKPLGEKTLPVSKQLTNFHQIAIAGLERVKIYSYRLKITNSSGTLTTDEFSFILP